MSWAKLDDAFPDNLKVEALSDPAFRAHVRAICHSARLLDDGFVLRAVAKRWGQRQVNECLASVWHLGDNLCEHCIELLTTKGEYETAPSRPDSIYVHDFLDYNRSRAEVNGERTATRTRKERWAERVRNADQNGSQNGAPTRPDVPTEHSRAKRRAKECPECGVEAGVGHAEDCSKLAKAKP